MPINTTRLATRLGSLVKALNEANVTNANSRAQFVAGVQGYALALLTQEVLADRPQTPQDLDSLFTEWTRQMALVPDSFATATASTTVSAIGTPTGNPRWVTSDLDLFGQRSDSLLPDTVLLRARTADTVTAIGLESTDKTGPLWPRGAGVFTFVSLTDPSAASNLNDPGFASWAGSPLAPTSWSIQNGIAGTNILRSTETYINSPYSLRFVGTAAVQNVRQDATALTNGVYALHVALRKGTAVVNTGTVSVTLRDNAGNVLSSTGVSQAFSGLTAGTWTPVTAVLYVPRQVTNGAWLDVRWTGGSGDTLDVTAVSVIPLPELYNRGLRLTGFRGTTNMVLDADQWTATTTLDGGTPATGKLARGIDRLLNVTNLSARLPTSGSPTQADSLIA